MLKLKFYSDPAHGWCAIKLHVLKDLGILERISPYSYIRGKTAYLEEDLDYSALIQALFDHRINYSLTEKHINKRSPIRSYDNFNYNQAYITIGF